MGPGEAQGFGGVRPAWGCPCGHAGLRVWSGARPWAWEIRSPDAPPQPRCSPGTAPHIASVLGARMALSQDKREEKRFFLAAQFAAHSPGPDDPQSCWGWR